MVPSTSAFKLIPGVEFTVPAWAIPAIFDSKHASRFPDTPMVLPLRHEVGGQVTFCVPRRKGEPRDAMGYGRFAGDGGMALLARYPVQTEHVQDMTGFLWRDLPGALLPPDLTAEVLQQQRLSTTGHWAVPFAVGDTALTVLAYHPSPPVFDGPEDRNGRRNHDESALWLHYLAGELPFAAPQPPFVLLGQTNLDPADGEGRREAVTALLRHPALQDPAPRGSAMRSDPGQSGDPALDTALYPDLGGLRVEVILPSADLAVTGAAVVWPPPDDPLAPALEAASRHRPLWVELAP